MNAKDQFSKEDVHRLGIVMLRKGGFREFTPSLNTEIFTGRDPNKGPITIVFDLHHDQNPKMSKPLAHAHLTPTQSIQLIADLVRAHMRIFPLRMVSEILSEIKAEIPRANEEHARTCPLCGRALERNSSVRRDRSL